MGQSQSQKIDRFIDTSVKTTAINEVIRRYADRTDSIVKNVQDMDITIIASGNISGSIDLQQKIESVIDVEQMVDTADLSELSTDLDSAISTELKGAIERYTDGLDLFSKPSNQEIRNEIINNIDNYTRQTINTSSVSELLLESSNFQNGRLYIEAKDISGNIKFTQAIQTKAMSKNLIKRVMDAALENKVIEEISEKVDDEVKKKEESPVSKILNIPSFGAYAAAGVAIVSGIIFSLLFPGPIVLKILFLIIGLSLGIALFLYLRQKVK